VPPAYRDFYYPLNVFMHILTHEEGDVDYLHYGVFDDPADSIGAAQERATELLLARLPPSPAVLLEVGIGLGTTLALLARAGYDVEGITPDEKQIAVARERHPAQSGVHCASFETFAATRHYDAVFFQESSQYIDSDVLFRRCAELTGQVIVADEFALVPIETPGALHRLDHFLEAAARHGFNVLEQLDLSARAAPTIDYFLERLPRFRESLVDELGLDDKAVDELIASGRKYRAQYDSGVYSYRLFDLRHP
jgi:SAM-dependent methyltransferase